jgi:hypothetical protein
MYIVEKYPLNRKQSENPGTFRQCEKKIFGGAGKNFPARTERRMGGRRRISMTDWKLVLRRVLATCFRIAAVGENRGDNGDA